jgi:enterochelin esterase-like enzyme
MVEIKGNSVRFIYKGEAETVCIRGDFNNWQKEKMHKKGANEWEIIKRFPLNARFDYKFVIDNEDVLDTENPFVNEGGFGFNSELRMPNFHYPKAVFFHKNIEHGEMVKAGLTDKTYFKYKRDIYVYIPHHSAHVNRAIVFQDGLEYILFGAAKNTLDYLIYAGKIPPIIGIFVDIRKDRRIKEYSAHSKYHEFLVRQVIPYIESKKHTKFTEIYIAGVSLGGYVSIDTVMKHPDIFNGAISQSGALLFNENDDFANLKGKTIYMDCGKFETQVDESMDIVFTNKFFSKKFKKSGASVALKIWNDGHSWGNWKAHLPQALETLFREASK